MSKNCPDCTPFDDIYKKTVCKDSVPSSCVPYNGASIIPLNIIKDKDNLNTVIKKISDGLKDVSDRATSTPIDLSVIDAKIAVKASLPDGITKIGTVAISIHTVTIDGFTGNYQGVAFTLPTSTVILEPLKDAGIGHPPYSRLDLIYYNPASKTYGRVSGENIQNPVKPIPVTPENTFKIATVKRNADGSNDIKINPPINFVTTNTLQSIDALKNFNEGIGSDKELINIVKPINTFWQPGFYVNYQNTLSNGSTLFIDDPESFFGKVIKIPIGAGNVGHAIFGPYETRLAPGDWVYEFRLKVSNNASTQDTIIFDIAVNGVTWTDHFIIIKPSDFPVANQYKTFRMPFTATKGTGYEFRIRTLITPNPIDISFDYGIAKQTAYTDLISLNELKDVDITNPLDGQILKLVAGKWVNSVSSTGGGGNMLASVYDINNSGIVDNSEKLGGELASFYLSRGNHNGTQTASTISDFDSAIAANYVVASNTAAKHTHTNITALNAVSGVNTGDQDLSTLATNTALATAITNLKGGVSTNGDTLGKLYNLILASSSEVTVANIAARNAYNVPSLPFNVFVTNDGDGNWALYKATTTGVNANYIKLNDYDNQNAVQTASQIKLAYESNPDTNAFTNSLKSKLDAILGSNTGDQTITLTGDVTGTGTGSFITSIGAGKVTNLMLAGAITASKILEDSTHRFITDTERAKLTGISANATANSSDVFLLNRANHSGTQSADTIIDGATNKVYTETDKTKLSGIATGATVNSTNAFLLNRTNHTGTQSTDTLVDGTTSKVFTVGFRDKLNGVATNATANSTDSFLLNRLNHTGTQSADTIVDGFANKVFSATEKSKLSGIQVGATVNSTDSFLLNRSNHTGSQPATTISEDSTHRFVTDSEKANWNSKQVSGDYATNTTLNNALATKQAALVSGSNIKTVNGQSILGTGDIVVTGGGTGSGDMLKSVYDSDGDGKVNSAITADNAPWAGISGKPTTFAPTAHTHSQAEIVNLSTDLAGKAPTTSPAFSGTPSAPTAIAGTNTNQLATTAFVVSERSNTATLTNKTISGANNTLTAIPQSAVTNLSTDLGNKQTTLVSGTNVKTVGGTSILGSGDIPIVIPNNYIVRETPTGSVNGINKVFSLAFTPISGKEMVFQNGLLKEPTLDYTLSGNTITFVIAPDASGNPDFIRVTYIK